MATGKLAVLCQGERMSFHGGMRGTVLNPQQSHHLFLKISVDIPSQELLSTHKMLFMKLLAFPLLEINGLLHFAYSSPMSVHCDGLYIGLHSTQEAREPDDHKWTIHVYDCAHLWLHVLTHREESCLTLKMKELTIFSFFTTQYKNVCCEQRWRSDCSSCHKILKESWCSLLVKIQNQHRSIHLFLPFFFFPPFKGYFLI